MEWGLGKINTFLFIIIMDNSEEYILYYRWMVVLFDFIKKGCVVGDVLRKDVFCKVLVGIG